MADKYSKSWINKLSRNHDGLFEKLSSTQEGWRIRQEDKDFDVPLNTVDASAYNILCKTIDAGERVVLALPRVRSGVALSIVAYAVINRFIQQHDRVFPNLIPLSLKKGRDIVVATKNRKLRDYFLESSLMFSNQNFPFTYFPINRLNTQGCVIPLVNRNDRIQIRSDPVVFYHFDFLDCYPKSIHGSYVIGEISETDSRNFTERLCDFINKIEAESVFIIANEYDYSSLSLLSENNFKTITYNHDQLKFLVEGETNLPSLGSSLAGIQDSINLNIELVEDEKINLKFNKILNILLKLNKQLEGKNVIALRQVWGLFFTFKDLSVPLEELEKYRKNNAWLKTIKYQIDQIFDYPLTKFDSDVRIIMESIWGALKTEFKDVYDQILDTNPKWNTLKKVINTSTEIGGEWNLVFTSRSQADVFKQVTLSDNSVQLKSAYISDLINTFHTCKNIIIPNVWGSNSDAKILSLLPHKITMLSYLSELPSIPKILNRINQERNMVSDKLTRSTILQIFNKEIEIEELNNNQHPDILILDEDSKFWITNCREILPKEKDDFIFDDSLIEATDIFPFDEGEDLDSINSEYDEIIESNDESDEMIEVFTVTLDNDIVIYIPINQEVIAYSEDSGVEIKLTKALEPEDVILLYSEQQNKEMFENAKKRTQELAGVRPEIIDLWGKTMNALRIIYDIDNPNSLKVYLNDLQNEGCTKVDQTVKQWLSGITFAPRDAEDIKKLLNLVGLKDANQQATTIHAEIEKERVFHRLLGKRIRHRLEAFVKSGISISDNSPLDSEIDEILEMAKPVAIKDIVKEIKYIQKSRVRLNIFR